MSEYRPQNLAFLLVLGAVLCAAVASLFYEVLWISQLGFSLGSTAIATSIMLSAFLGGLAIGSSAMGRRSDALKHPARVFGVVELIAVVIGLASIPALGAAGRAYVFLATHWDLTGSAALAMRGVFSLVVMLIPAIIFGMTFPLATALAGRLVAAQTAAGSVSAVSSFGSAAGALICGLWLAPLLGITRTSFIAAGFNLAAAALAFSVAWLVARTEQRSPRRRGPA
ncbi:MAG: hypothetical protein FWC54_01135 [Actinomycetia bacterium]|nr:hypothetical protein [Actinomycetes bacterium]